MITATSSPDRFGSLLRGLLKKNIPNMVYLALIGFIGIPLPYLLAMFRRWEEKGQWVYENISTADRGGLYVGIAVGTVCLLWLAGSFILALSGVGYMHNRRAVDLYHSLPVTRGQLLLGHVLANFLTVALPMTANTLLTTALAGIRHGMTPDRSAFHLGAIALDLLGWYVTAFAIIVMVYLAATQVGSTFDTFLFSGVFLAALPVLCLTHTVMCQNYLAGWNYDMKWQIFCVLTPVLTMIGSYTTYGEWLYAAMAIWLAAGVLLALLGKAFSPKAGRIIVTALWGIFSIFYMGQVVYYAIFKVYFTLFSVGGAGQVAQFSSVIFSTILQCWWALLLMLVPIALLLWQGKKRIAWGHEQWKELLWPLIAALALQIITTGGALLDTGGAMSVSRLYTTDFISNLSVSRFGLLTTFRIEARNAIFGPMPAVTVEELEPEPEPEPEPEAEKQVMEIDFAALAEATEDQTLAEMYRYFAKVTPSTKNEYTGYFAGKNLIFLTCESLWKYAIDPNLTPNLYKLWSEGFQFTNFYNPIWGVSTLDGEYVNLLGMIPVTGTWSMTESATNWLPFSFGNQFRTMGYTTRAYHDHTYTYYSRDKSHPNLGYDYKGVGNGLNIKVMWPESDVDMMNATLDTVLADEHFMTYYLTVSGHLEYNFFGNAMAMRNEEAVAELDLPEAARAYLACNIELDKAIGVLLQKLEETGHDKDTVIMLAPDHYPYGLDIESLNALAGRELDQFSLYQSCFLIWSADMEGPVVIDKPVSSLDILPTVSNLFDLPYDSRLMMGTDMLSDTSSPVIFQDHSWLTAFGCYNASTDHYTSLIDTGSDDYYVSSMNRLVDQKFNYSKLILRKDFFRHLWDDAGLWPAEEPVDEEPAAAPEPQATP